MVGGVKYGGRPMGGDRRRKGEEGEAEEKDLEDGHFSLS